MNPMMGETKNFKYDELSRNQLPCDDGHCRTV